VNDEEVGQCVELHDLAGLHLSLTLRAVDILRESLLLRVPVDAWPGEKTEHTSN
jgi:hypothetical protein